MCDDNPKKWSINKGFKLENSNCNFVFLTIFYQNLA